MHDSVKKSLQICIIVWLARRDWRVSPFLRGKIQV